MLSHGTSAHVPSTGLLPATPAELAAASWLAGYPNAKTRESYTIHIRDWFAFAADHELDPMSALRAHIELWVRGLEQRGLKPRTRALKITTVRSFYAYCVEEEWIDKSPADRVKRPSIERKSPRGALGRTQLADLVDGARALGPNQHALVMLLGFNGLRIGETCAANVEDMEYRGFSPVLLLPNRKGGKEGEAPLSRPLEAALHACIGERTSGPLLRNRYGNRMTRSNAQQILDTASKNVRGRMPRLSPHVLRHTWVTLAVDAGADQSRIQHDGGWADSRLVAYYCHSRHDPLNATTHLVAAHVMSAA